MTAPEVKCRAAGSHNWPNEGDATCIVCGAQRVYDSRKTVTYILASPAAPKRNANRQVTVTLTHYEIYCLDLLAACAFKQEATMTGREIGAAFRALIKLKKATS